MVPAAVVLIDELPLTAHGKVNRQALAERPLPQPAAADPLQDNASDPADAHVEQVLAEVWAEILGLTTVGPHDNFFDIGGDSLRVIRLINQSRRKGLTLRPEDVYAHPVLRDLAGSVRVRQPPRNGDTPDTARPSTGMVPPR
jgi:aryl carrier-like protein